jgi:hypothetical protein
MQQLTFWPKPLRSLAGWVAVFVLITLYMKGWPGSSMGRWSELVISSVISGGVFAWLHALSGFRIK